VILLLLAPAAVRADALDRAGQAHAQGEPRRVLEILPWNPAEPLQRLLRARALLDLHSPGEAEVLLRELERELPRLTDLVWLLRGQALAGQQRHAEAAAAFRRAERTGGSHHVDRARELRADALLAGGLYRQAVPAYRRILISRPDHPQRPRLELSLARALLGARFKQQAATALQEIWLRWPESRAAAEARERLERLAQKQVRPAPPPWWRLLDRVRRLRRKKEYRAALDEIARLRADNERSRVRLAQLDLEQALTHLKDHRPDKALPLLQALVAAAPGGEDGLAPRKLRWLLADCLTDLGRAAEVEPLLLRGAYDRRRQVLAARLPDLERAALMLARGGQYKRALALTQQLMARRPSRELRRRRGWLAYRAGQYDRAIQDLEKLGQRRRGYRGYALYWQARAHNAAGRPDRADALYEELVENQMWSYYGLLARSRLVELGKLKLTPGSCNRAPGSRTGGWLASPAGAGVGSGARRSPWFSADRPRVCDPRRQAARARPPQDPTLALLDDLAARYGDLLPGVRRVRTLWRLGMRRQARLELRLVATDFSWVLARGRPAYAIQRPEAERVWAGGPPPRRYWSAPRRRAWHQREAIRTALRPVLQATGLEYFAWRLRPDGRASVRWLFPRAFAPLVQGEALRHRLDPNLIWAIMRTESSYRPDVISPVGATGLMQIMPNTGRLLSRAMKLPGFRHDQLFQPEVNLKLSAWYLRAVMDKFQQQVPLVAAAYNGGPHNVARWLRRRGQGAALDEFVEEMTFSQSRRYAKKVVRLMALYERVHCGKDDLVLSNRLLPAYKPYPNF
jgi:soluble lytic murein transglycosylase-like protein